MPVVAAPQNAPSAVASASSHLTRMALEIQTVEETEGLAEHEFVQAVRLFQYRAEAPDAHLAIQSRRARSLYLRAELDDFARVPQSWVGLG